ncbi:MAG: DNA polymerase alpha subunit B, partial [Marteilia pararefringens]
MNCDEKKKSAADTNSLSISSLKECLRFFDVHLFSKTNRERSLEESLLNDIINLCERYGMSVKEFANSWIAFSMNRKIEILDSDNLMKFEINELQHISKEKNKIKSCDKENLYSSPQKSNFGNYMRNDSSSDNDDSILSIYNSPSPSNKKRFLTPYRKFSAATNEAALLSPIESIAKAAKDGYCELRCLNELSEAEFSSQMQIENQKKQPFNTQFIVATDAENYYYFNSPHVYLKSSINERIELFKQNYDGFKFSDITEIHHSSQFYIGMFINFNKSQDTLEKSDYIFLGCDEISRNCHVKCNFSQLKSFSVFSGMVAVIKGKNPDGNVVHIEEILPSNHKSDEFKRDDKTQNADFCIINGPILNGNTKPAFAFAKRLFNYLSDNNIKLCIVVGDLVSCNSEIKHEETMNHENLHYIDNFGIQNDVHFLTIPTLGSDNYMSIYPQKLIESTPTADIIKQLSNIEFLTNPTQFQYKGFNFICNSIDSLLAIGSNDFSKNQPLHRIDNLIGKVLDQRFIYPVIGENETTPVDYRLLSSYGFFKSQHIDIFIQKSNLKHFIKCVNGVLCINLGKLQS